MELLENMDLNKLWDRIKKRVRQDSSRTAIDELKSFSSIQGIFSEKYIKGVHHRAYYIGDYQEEKTVEALWNLLSKKQEVSNFTYGPSYIAPQYYETPGWWMSLTVANCHIELFVIREHGKWIEFDKKKKQT